MNTVQILEAYWKEHPAWFGRSYGEYLHLGANQEMLRMVLAGISIQPGMRVLDLSTALGGNARWLASLFGCRVEGIDAFKPAIACAKKLAKAQGVADLVSFQSGALDALPFTDGAFDLAITTDDDVEWAELRRVLKASGQVVGSSVVSGEAEARRRDLEGLGFRIERFVDVTTYALAFYRAKEEEAKLLVGEGLMSTGDLHSLQMHTVDLYQAGSAHHVLFRMTRV